jgi:hypothetical protein
MYKINNVELTEEQAKEVAEMYAKRNGKKRKFVSDTQIHWYTDTDQYGMAKYATKEEADLAEEKEKALVRLWHKADDAYYFRPDWSNENEDKHFLYYNHRKGKIETDWFFIAQYQNQLPFFATEADAQKFATENEADLKLILTR